MFESGAETADDAQAAPLSRSGCAPQLVQSESLVPGTERLPGVTPEGGYRR
jgi:hypothetical protein